MSARSAIAIAIVALGLAAVWLWLRPGAPAEPEPSPAIAQSGDDARPSGAPASRGDDDDDAPRVAVVGKVISSAADEGIEGAVVLLRRHEEEGEGERDAIVRTDEGGGFQLDDVAPGKYALSATAPGHLPAVVRLLHVGTSAPDPVTLKLDAGGRKVHGTVEDITGGPIEGAMVRAVPVDGFAALRAHEGFATLTGEDGGYALHVASGGYRLEVSHPDYAGRSHAIEVGSGDLRQDFQLVPTAVIEGVVVDARTRAPIAEARVVWSRERLSTMPGGRRAPVQSGTGEVRSDAQGRFRIRGLQPGLVSLSARAKGRASAEPVVLPVAIAEHVDGVELVLVAAHEVRGRVVSKRDPTQGVAGASVSVEATGELAPARTVADEEGRFVLEGVLPGDHRLTAYATGYAFMLSGVDVTVEGDVEDVQLELDPGLTVSGRVEPPELAQVSLEMRPENMQIGQGIFVLGAGASEETDEDGAFALRPVQPGTVTVVARAADGRVGQVDVEVGPEGAEGVVVKLESRVTVSGTLTGTDGEPVAQALVSLRPTRSDGKRMRLTINGRDMGVDSSVTADDGSFRIAGLRAGDYEVEIVDRYGDALELKSGPVELASGRPVLGVPDRDRDGVGLVVDAHTGEISGTVRTAEGDPAPDVWVMLVRRPDLPDAAPRRTEASDEPREESRQEVRMVVSDDAVLGARERSPVLTGEDGTFRFTGLRDGEYDLIAESGGGSSRAMKTARPGDQVTLELAALGGVEGEVTLNGEAAESFVVSVNGPSSRTVHVRDAGGHFRIERLDPGAYDLRVTAGTGSGEAKFTVESGDIAERDIVLQELAKIVGTITDDSGLPIEGAMILIGAGSRESGQVQIQQDGSEGIITTDAEGKFDTRCAAGSRVMVAVQPGEPRPVVLEFFEAKAGETTDLGTLTPSKNGPPDRGPGGGAPRAAEDDAQAH